MEWITQFIKQNRNKKSTVIEQREYKATELKTKSTRRCTYSGEKTQNEHNQSAI